MSRFDLKKPETLLMRPEIDEALINDITETLFQKVLAWCKAIDVSDVVFQYGMPVMIKKSNLVFPISRARLSMEAVGRMIGIVYGAREGDESALQRVMNGEDSNTTYRFDVSRAGEESRQIRYRTNCLRDGDMEASIVMRLNNDQILKLSQIGQKEEGVIYQNMFPVKGLNLITGSVDSGKTTLIYACLRHFIESDPRHAFIDTYENPIEGDLRALAMAMDTPTKSVRQCPVPLGVKSYTSGVEQSLRRNADIILTGEIRTQDEVMGVIKGVLSSGKLVMGTMHTDNIPVSVNRMLDTLYSSNEGERRSVTYDLIRSLNMIVSQKLLTTVDLKRVAVGEELVFTREIKDRLTSISFDQIAREVKQIMVESEDTMVHRAKVLLEEGVINKTVFTEFERSFAY